MTRDFLAESIAIYEGRTIMLPQRAHIEALVETLKGFMKSADFELMCITHPYPMPEVENVRIVLPRGEA